MIKICILSMKLVYDVDITSCVSNTFNHPIFRRTHSSKVILILDTVVMSSKVMRMPACVRRMLKRRARSNLPEECFTLHSLSEEHSFYICFNQSNCCSLLIYSRLQISLPMTKTFKFVLFVFLLSV